MGIKEPEVTNKNEVEEMYKSFRKVFEANSPYEVRADYRAAFKIWADEYINNNKN